MTFDVAHARRLIDSVFVSDFEEEIVSSQELNAADMKVCICIAVDVEDTDVSSGCLRNLARLMTPCRLPHLLQ